jgi:hypothetical protein
MILLPTAETVLQKPISAVDNTMVFPAFVQPKYLPIKEFLKSLFEYDVGFLCYMVTPEYTLDKEIRLDANKLKDQLVTIKSDAELNEVLRQWHSNKHVRLHRTYREQLLSIKEHLVHTDPKQRLNGAQQLLEMSVPIENHGYFQNDLFFALVGLLRGRRIEGTITNMERWLVVAASKVIWRVCEMNPPTANMFVQLSAVPALILAGEQLQDDERLRSVLSALLSISMSGARGRDGSTAKGMVAKRGSKLQRQNSGGAMNNTGMLNISSLCDDRCIRLLMHLVSTGLQELKTPDKLKQCNHTKAKGYSEDTGASAQPNTSADAAENQEFFCLLPLQILCNILLALDQRRSEDASRNSGIPTFKTRERYQRIVRLISSHSTTTVIGSQQAGTLKEAKHYGFAVFYHIASLATNLSLSFSKHSQQLAVIRRSALGALCWLTHHQDTDLYSHPHFQDSDDDDEDDDYDTEYDSYDDAHDDSDGGGHGRDSSNSSDNEAKQASDDGGDETLQSMQKGMCCILLDVTTNLKKLEQQQLQLSRETEVENENDAKTQEAKKRVDALQLALCYAIGTEHCETNTCACHHSDLISPLAFVISVRAIQYMDPSERNIVFIDGMEWHRYLVGYSAVHRPHQELYFADVTVVVGVCVRAASGSAADTFATCSHSQERYS